METGQINLFDNLGFILVKLSDLEVAPIKSEISKIEANFSSAQKYNDNLAGNIKKEFLLKDSKDHIANLLQPLVSDYNGLNKNWVSKIAAETPYHYPEKGLVLREAWVNFQKKHEFNPPHNHTGVLSFVIWIKIPFNMEEELRNSPGAESISNMAGCFNFHYTNILGELVCCPIHADQSMENYIMMFPAKLSHSVSPFYTSNEFRISVSGNFVVDM